MPITRMDFQLSEQIPFRSLYLHYPRSGKDSWFTMQYDLEFGIVLEGRFRRHYPDHPDYQIELGPGQVWLHGMWEPHGTEILEFPFSVVLYVIWPPMISNLCFEEAPGVNFMSLFTLPPYVRPQVAEDERKRMYELGQEIKRNIQTLQVAEAEGEDLGCMRIRERLLLMEGLVNLYEGWKDRPAVSAYASDISERLNRVVQLVFASQRHIPVKEAAAACAMSTRTFIRYFQSFMGINFAQFAMRYRLSQVATQLIRTNDRLKTIADQWGFRDASHLHHAFSKRYGCTPRQYRQQARSQSPG